MSVRHRLLSILPWFALFAAFVAFGIWVRSIQPWFQNLPKPMSIEIYGLDYSRYGHMLDRWCMVFYAAFRHPLYGWLMSPVIGIGARIRTLGAWPFWVWIITFFSAVMTLAHFLVYQLLRRLSLTRIESAVLTALFASFAFSWFLAVCPESFNISCLLALVTIHFALYVHRHANTLSREYEYTGWVVLAVLTGGITSTQVVKTALAYFVTKRPTWRQFFLIGLGIVSAGILVGIVFCIRLYLRTPSGMFGHEFDAALGNISNYLVGDGKSILWRSGRVWVFFTEPIVTRGRVFSENILPTRYVSPLMSVVAILPPFLAMIAAWFARREFIVRLVGAMFLVDIGIHFVLFWGMEEAQIYAGHWFHIIPILIGIGLSRLNGRLRFMVLGVIAILAVTIFTTNFNTLR